MKLTLEARARGTCASRGGQARARAERERAGERESDEAARQVERAGYPSWVRMLPSKSAAHRDKNREWNVSKQKLNLC